MVAAGARPLVGVEMLAAPVTGRLAGIRVKGGQRFSISRKRVLFLIYLSNSSMIIELHLYR
jgi:hypothetical protein